MRTKGNGVTFLHIGRVRLNVFFFFRARYWYPRSNDDGQGRRSRQVRMWISAAFRISPEMQRATDAGDWLLSVHQSSNKPQICLRLVIPSDFQGANHLLNCWPVFFIGYWNEKRFFYIQSLLFNEEKKTRSCRGGDGVDCVAKGACGMVEWFVNDDCFPVPVLFCLTQKKGNFQFLFAPPSSSWLEQVDGEEEKKTRI